MDLFGQADEGEPVGWVRMETTIFSHPKVLAAGPQAALLFIASICWSGEYLTDGDIPAYALRHLAAQIDVSETVARELADKLTEVRAPGSTKGLWERSPDGWKVHDWEHWQEDGNARKEAREAANAKSARKAMSKKRALTRALSPPLSPPYSPLTPTSGFVSALEEEVEVDVEVPPPTPPKGGEQPFEQEFDRAWALYPRKLNRKAALRAYTATRRRGVPAADLLLATEGFVKAMAAEGREWRLVKHGSTFFGPDEPWQDYLPDGPGLTEGGSGATIDRIAAARERLRAEHEALSGR